jgi:hypothetical protein
VFKMAGDPLPPPPQPTFQAPCPEPFPFSMPSAWPRWRKKFERFSVSSGLTKKADDEKVNTLIYLMGDQADDILLSFHLSAAEQKVYKTVIDKFEACFVVRRNVIYERAKFNVRVQEEGETVDDFITSLYTLTEYCEYGALHDEMIRDRIVVGVKDRKLSEKLQFDTSLTLEGAMTKARQHEAVKKQQTDLRGEPVGFKMDRLTTKHHQREDKKDRIQSGKQSKSKETTSAWKCMWCGGSRKHP